MTTTLHVRFVKLNTVSQDTSGSYVKYVKIGHVASVPKSVVKKRTSALIAVDCSALRKPHPVFIIV